MAYETRLLLASRAYEYSVDSLRLTVLSLPRARERIERAFAFRTALIETPPPVFGPVPRTFPPGMVFESGVFNEAEIPVPIRFLNVEQRRIVIGVAGPSSAIDLIFQRLNELLADLQAPDGTKALGTHQSVQDFSDISRQVEFPLQSLLEAELQSLFSAALASPVAGAERVLVPKLQISLEPTDSEYRPTEASLRKAITLELRADTYPNDRILFSQAPLTTDDHLAFLDRLETIARDLRRG